MDYKNIYKRCTCGEEYVEPHTCPYSEEITGNTELCQCCDYCTHECCMDI